MVLYWLLSFPLHPSSLFSGAVAASSSQVHVGALTGTPHGVPIGVGVTRLGSGSSWKSECKIVVYLFIC